MWHAATKLHKHMEEQQLAARIDAQRKARAEKRKQRWANRAKKEEGEWVPDSEQWLQEHQTIDAASQGADRDALKHQEDLGNDSGPSEGPGNL